MGMFDSIKCKKELPLTDELKTLDVRWSEVTFQTKDLDNCLGNYIISDSGELLEEIIKYEYTYYTEEERKKKGHSPWCLIKDQKEIERSINKIDFHGTIAFYDSFKYNNLEDVWVDFKAYFVYGKLDKLELVKVEKYESRDIKMEEFWEKHKREKNSFKYKLKKYSGWFYFWGKMGRCCNNSSRFFSNLHAFINRNFL